MQRRQAEQLPLQYNPPKARDKSKSGRRNVFLPHNSSSGKDIPPKHAWAKEARRTKSHLLPPRKPQASRLCSAL
jgi:hypothetical protein